MIDRSVPSARGLRNSVRFAVTGFLIATAMAATDFTTESKNLIPSSPTWKAERGEISAVASGFQITAAATGTAVFSAPITVEPQGEYFFSAEVNSADRVVFYLAGLSMSYHDQGTAQTISGLVRSKDNTALELRVQLRSLESGRPAKATISNLVLRKVERPKTATPRARNGNTQLVNAAKAQATIVYPASSAILRDEAASLQRTIQEITGVELPMISDKEATEANHPILKPALRDRNLILLGQIGNNRALWPAYNRFLTAEDGYYPGGDGFVVRTAANVFGNLRNQIILGGSSEKGAQKAVAAFQKILKETPFSKDQSWEVPWLLEVELGGACQAAFAADEQLWQDPENPLHHAMTSGYGKVVRWYQNAMGYYWSGQKSYLERSRQYLREILEEKAHTHHYIVEFFIRTYDMLDDSPVFSPEEIQQLDSLVLQNFLDFLTVTDLGWMTVFSPPYSDIGITNRHQICPWYGDLLMARFLARNVKLTGDLQELVRFRESEKDRAFRAFASSRNGPSLPGMAASSDFEEIPATFFRFALENDLYEEFFASGLAHQTLALERFDHIAGRNAFPACQVDLGMWLGAMALLTDDARYQWLNQNIPFAFSERGPFQGRYVAKVHRYQPGDGFPSKEPGLEWAGIQISPQPHKEQQTAERTMTKFPLLTIRGGFNPEDDYLLVAGLNRVAPSGTLVGLTINGISAFGSANAEDGGGSSRVTTNGASAIRLNGFKMGVSGADDASQPSSVEWFETFPGFWSVRVDTEISKDLQWSRIITRLDNGVFAFADTFTAKLPGKYLLQVGWQPNYSVSAHDAGWRMVTNKGGVQIQMAGPGFSGVQRGNSLAWESIRTMQAGDQATVWTLVHGTKPNQTDWKIQARSPNQVNLTNGSKRSSVLHRGALTTGKETIQADFIGADAQGAAIFAWQQTAESPAKSVYLPAGNSSETASAPGTSFAEIVAALKNQPELPAPEAESTGLALIEAQNEWKTTWTYRGLLRPTLLKMTNLSDQVVDFGRPVSLVEIRSRHQGRSWGSTELPRDIQAAKPELSTAPEPGAEGWVTLKGKYQDRPGTRTGNYGESHPQSKVDESLFLTGVTTRFIKGPGAEGWKYYTDEVLAARHPIRLSLFQPSGQENTPLIVAKTDNFPAFPRPIRDDDFSLVLLNAANGNVVTQLEIPGPIQATLLADQKGTGNPEILVLKADVQLESYDLTGRKTDSVALYEQFSEFQKKHGRENTRGPAGGHYMPFSFGLWRTNASGASKIVIGRYGSIAFLDENRQLEGILNFPSYGSPGMLPRGYDFDGNGQEEMLMLERFNLIHMAGEPKPEVRDAAVRFWPQVYELAAVRAPKDAGTNLLSGAPIHIFSVLEQFGSQPRYALIVRSNYLAIYDAVTKQWILSWRPPAPISGAAVVKEDAQRLEVALATVDGILWNITWDLRRMERPAIALQPTPLTIGEIQPGPDNDGTALISAQQGLFIRTASGELQQIANGSYQSAIMPSRGQVTAASTDGEIVNLKNIRP